MPKVKVYRCSHSGMYFPPDYTKKWGQDYGIGQGPEPTSECLDSVKTIPPTLPKIIRGIEDLMHPLRVTFAQVDLCEVEESEYEANRLILAKDDPFMVKRTAILLEKQKKARDSRLNFYAADLARRGVKV